MTDDPAVEVKNVYKYFIPRGNTNSIKDFIVYREKKSKVKHEVLNNISFSVNRGEALGIIGRNGSGKSTILKMLTKILRPNQGEIIMRGRVSCLIELGAGFHPDMTGRENIFINASIFGLNNKEIEERFDKIVEFSEIGDHIDERVRNYSSGMYMRLAFAIAINVNADILVIDEILAVGDIQFQDKCMKKLMELKNNGVTIVLVTQTPDQVKQMCNRAIWIDNGVIREQGDPEYVCDAYVKELLG